MAVGLRSEEVEGDGGLQGDGTLSLVALGFLFGGGSSVRRGE